jgi:hypothetical protein
MLAKRTRADAAQADNRSFVGATHASPSSPCGACRSRARQCLAPTDPVAIFCRGGFETRPYMRARMRAVVLRGPRLLQAEIVDGAAFGAGTPAR